jgi:hypothetical protein
VYLIDHRADLGMCVASYVGDTLGDASHANFDGLSISTRAFFMHIHKLQLTRWHAIFF